LNAVCPEFFAVLVPLEPAEGKQRLLHMLSDARPALTLTAADCDMEYLQQAFDTLKESPDPASGSSQGLVRIQQLELVDFRGLVRLAMNDMHRDQRLRAAVSETLSDPSRMNDSIQQLVQDFERALQRLQALEQPDARMESPARAEHNSINSNRISHIVYTSGTTGVPKGCISSSKVLQHYIQAKNMAHNVTCSSVVLLASALSFDPCLSDILATLAARATLGLARRDELSSNLHHALQSLDVSNVLCTPTLWSTLQVIGVQPANLPTLRRIALGGEPIPKRIVQVWARTSTQDESACRLYATFGVTEACVYQTMGEVFRETSSDRTVMGQPVGTPFSSLSVQICREENQEVLEVIQGTGYPLGVGEVTIYGAQLDEHSGYLGRSELRYKFVHDPIAGRYYYRTGDRGYLDPITSQIFILGRIHGEDGMVKFNGVRVELGEIEAALVDDLIIEPQQLSIVVDSLVVAGPGASDHDSSATNELLAYCIIGSRCKRELGLLADIPASGVFCTAGPLLALLRERCKQRARITPSAFVLLPRVPLSRTGKRDRHEAPPLNESVPLDSLFSTGDLPCVPLREYGKSGALVAEQIIDCLNLQPSQEALLTTAATFAMLGGDSLGATRVVRALFAYHHNTRDSRFLGGQYGVLDGPFKVVHLFTSKSLGAYIDWLDQNGLCLPRATSAVGKASQNLSVTGNTANQLVVIGATEGNEAAADASSVRETESSQLYDALLQACTRGYSTIAKALLDVGVDPNYGKHNGRLGKTSGRSVRKKVFRSSPLHLACLRGDPSMVQKLLEHKAIYNSPDASGVFPIQLAATGELSGATCIGEAQDLRRLECCKLLWDAGVPLTMRDGNKQSVLHVAARSGCTRLLRYALQKWKDRYDSTSSEQVGSNKQDGLEWRDHWYRTPVHWAVLNQRVDALQALLEAGCRADPFKPKVNKRCSFAIESPLEMCNRLYGDSQVGVRISKLLLDAIGNIG
jgi:acyl-CoA synthetase (AMP-forming)/AMP-acid ligase II/ankyrin repeat protein